MRIGHLLAIAVAGSLAIAISITSLRRPEEENRPPTPAELVMTHYLTGVRVNNAGAFIEIPRSEDGASPDHILVGDIDSGEYFHILLNGNTGLYHVRRGGSARIFNLNPGRVEPPFILSRADGKFSLYSNGVFKREFDPGVEQVAVVLAWNREMAGERPRVRHQDIEAIRFEDNFMRMRVGSDDGWDRIGGTWRIIPQSAEGTAPNPFTLRATGEEGAAGMLQIGYDFWNNYRLGLSINPTPDSTLGFAFALGEDNYRYLAVIRHDENAANAELLRVGDGDVEILASRRLGYLAGRWTRVELAVVEGRPLVMLIDGNPVLEAKTDRALFGRVGIYVERDGGYLDDFAVASIDQAAHSERFQSVVRKSDTFEEKPLYVGDGRDAYLHRWASDTDAWEGTRFEIDGKSLAGYLNSTTLFGDFRTELPGAEEPWIFALLDPDRNPIFVRNIEPSDSAIVFERRGDALFLAGDVAQSLEASAPVRLGVFSEASVWPLAGQPPIFAKNIRVDFFESAPVRWMPVSGSWDLTTRWQCEQKWSFFGGIGVYDAILFSKDRYDGNQSHEFYYAMKDIFNREFENRRYVRRDVNFSFATDGKDLNSGYTFMYGGNNNTASILMKGDRVVAWNDKAVFPQFTGSGSVADLHAYWWRIKVEMIGRRIIITRDDQVLFDWVDAEKDAPQGGHIALWTHRNGIVYTRAKSTAESISDESSVYFESPGRATIGGWASLEPHRVRLHETSHADGGFVRVVNEFGGGGFGVSLNLGEGINLAETPVLELPFRPGEGAMVNLHVVIARRSVIFGINAPSGETYRALTPGAPSTFNWRPFAATPLGSPYIVPDSYYDAEAGVIRIDLEAEIVRLFPRMGNPLLTALIVGNASNSEYLMAGFGGNASGSWYEVGEPRFVARPAVNGSLNMDGQE